MSDIRKIEDSTANPAPLGLLGFGMTTVLLNLHNAGFIGLGSMILAMGICYGGLAQVIAGVMEWKKGNTFGTVAFVSYGFFWLSLVALLVLPRLGMAEVTEPAAMGAYLLVWGLLTLVLLLASLRTTVATVFVFASLLVLFILLAIADFSGSTVVKTIAGYEGLVCGLSAIYDAAGQLINEKAGKTVLPLCPLSK